MTEPQTMTVRDVMKTSFQTIDGTATITDALRQMREHKSVVLVVNKRHDDDEYGLLTVPHIARKVLARRRSPNRVNVYEVMSKPVVKVHPDMDIAHCARLFDRFHMVRALVEEDRKLIGTISPRALVIYGLAKMEGID